MGKNKTCEVKESRVRELAKECPDYKRALQILFPEVIPRGCGCSQWKMAAKDGSISTSQCEDYFTFGTGWVFEYCSFCGEIII